jgi:hypothetical protein
MCCYFKDWYQNLEGKGVYTGEPPLDLPCSLNVGAEGHAHISACTHTKQSRHTHFSGKRVHFTNLCGMLENPLWTCPCSLNIGARESHACVIQTLEIRVNGYSPTIDLALGRTIANFKLKVNALRADLLQMNPIGPFKLSWYQAWDCHTIFPIPPKSIKSLPNCHVTYFPHTFLQWILSSTPL